ncbi:unnamed protein product [Boreogadus saida]
MDFWENIPSRKEQEAVLGRTRRAVSSRPELEDALPEWAVELLSPTAFWPESYMPLPPDFAPALSPRPVRFLSPLLAFQRGTGLFACLRWSALRSCLWRSALCSCRRWPALQTIQRGPALHLAFLLRGPALYLAFAGLLKVSAFATAGLQRGFLAAAGLLRD